MQNSNVKRIRELDILKGLGIIFVIMGHSLLVYPVDFTNIAWAKILRWFIYSFHMPLFFVVAGITYKCNNYYSYFEKKIKRLIVPFVIFGIIEYLSSCLFSNLVNSKPSPLIMWMKDFFVFGRNGWFLQTMFIICAIYPFIDSIFKKKASKIFIMILFLIIDWSVMVPNYWALPYVVKYFPYFVFGNLIKYKTKDVNNLKNHQLMKIIICVTIYILSVVLIIYFKFNYPMVLFICALSLIILLFLIINICSSNNKSDSLIVNFIIFCGENSLQMYLFQPFALTIFRTIICKLTTSPPVIFVLLFSFVVPTCTIACRLVKQIPIISNLCGYVYNKKNIMKTRIG